MCLNVAACWNRRILEQSNSRQEVILLLKRNHCSVTVSLKNGTFYLRHYTIIWHQNLRVPSETGSEKEVSIHLKGLVSSLKYSQKSFSKFLQLFFWEIKVLSASVITLYHSSMQNPMLELQAQVNTVAGNY